MLKRFLIPVPPAPRLRTLALLGLGVSALPFAALPVAAADEQPVTTVTVEAERPSLIGQPEDAEGVKDYRVTRTKSGAKMDVATAEVPQSVIVVPQKVLEEQNAETINDALRNVAGIQATQSNLQGAGQWVTVRGFQNRNFYKDGLRDDLFDRTYWMGNVERIEVLKGPASVLYGDGSLGGAINVVSKKPLQTNQVGATLTGGSNDLITGAVDLNSRLTDDGSALVRLIADKGHRDTFADTVSYDSQHASLIGQAQLGERTAITLSGEYRERQTNGNVSGVPAYSRWLDLDRSTNFNTDWSGRTDVGANVAARLRHEFNDDWSVNTALMLNRYEFQQVLSTASYTQAQIASRLMSIGSSKTDSTTDEILSDTNVEGKFRLAGLQNRVLFGADNGYYDIERTVYRGTASSGSLGTSGLYAHSTAGQPVWSLLTSSATDFVFKRSGFYAQDLVELTPELKVMGGLRYDNVYREQKNRYTKALGSSHDEELSYRGGVTYEVLPGVTPFFGYSRSFVPPGDENTVTDLTGTSANVVSADPEFGTQYEGGVKLDLGRSFTATAALYQLTRENVRVTDVSTNPATVFVVGEQRSTGFELDATWTVAPGWNLLAAYAYTDARIVKDKKYAEGATLMNVPLNSARLWSMYEVQDGPLAGLGFGGGVNYVGKRAADLYNRYHMPEYATVDLAGYYKIGETAKISLNVDNLFDQRYYVASGAADLPMLYYGDPLSVIARLQVTY